MEHCPSHDERGKLMDAHDKLLDAHTDYISGDRANKRLLTIITGIAATIAISVVGYVQNETNKTIGKVAEGVSRVEGIVQANAIATTRFETKFQSLEADVNELKAVSPRVRK